MGIRCDDKVRLTIACAMIGTSAMERVMKSLR